MPIHGKTLRHDFRCSSAFPNAALILRPIRLGQCHDEEVGDRGAGQRGGAGWSQETSRIQNIIGRVRKHKKSLGYRGRSPVAPRQREGEPT